jgi:hypothetical protein
MRHRWFRALSAHVQKTLGVTVRVAVTTFVLGACVVSLLHYMGVPLPSAHELLHGLPGYSTLSKMVS